MELQYLRKQIADLKKHIHSGDRDFEFSKSTGKADVEFNLYKMPGVNSLGYQSVVLNRPLSWSSSSTNDVSLSLMWLYIKKRKSSEYLKSTSTNNQLSNIVSESEVQTIVNIINDEK